VLAEDVVAGVDVPGFDRSNVDGFAMQANDSFGALEEQPRAVRPQTTRFSRLALHPKRKSSPASQHRSPPAEWSRAAQIRC
jgi:molybdopterin biosynthesis enzyme